MDGIDIAVYIKQHENVDSA